MGQNVEIRDMMAVGEVLLIDTDRSFTGQDGEVVTPDEPGDGVPALLGARLLGLGLGIDHVFVQQNQVSVRRPGGWDEETKGRVGDVTRNFLRYYPNDEAPSDEK